MEKRVFILMILLLLSFGLLFSQNQKLTIVIKNIKTTTYKNIYVSVFNSDGSFPTTNFLKEQILKVNNISCNVIFEIPYGEYAVAVFHDINDNKKLDTNLFGAPKEPVGFSNNFKPAFSPPKFNDCRFVFKATNPSITINLID